MCNTCQTCNSYAQRGAISKINQGGYLGYYIYIKGIELDLMISWELCLIFCCEFSYKSHTVHNIHTLVLI